jgi:outer membrane lipoprotein-sorting protein
MMRLIQPCAGQPQPNLKAIRRPCFTIWAFVAFTAFTWNAPAAATAAVGQTYSCVMHATTSMDNQKRTQTVRLWLKSTTKFRLEQTSGSQSMVTIANGMDAWIIRNGEKTAYHTRQKPDVIAKLQAKPRVAGDIVTDFITKGGKKTGKEKIDGVLCDVYKRTDADKMRHTLWVLPGPDRLARRQVSEGVTVAAAKFGDPMQTHILRSQTDFSDWQLGKPMPESLFTLPAGMKIIEAPVQQTPPGALPKR